MIFLTFYSRVTPTLLFRFLNVEYYPSSALGALTTLPPMSAMKWLVN